MYSIINKQIEQTIIKTKLDKSGNLSKIVEEANEMSIRLDDLLVKKHLLTEEQKCYVLATMTGYPYVNLDKIDYNANVIMEVNSSFVNKHFVLPVISDVYSDDYDDEENDDDLTKNLKTIFYTVVIADPFNMDCIRMVHTMFGINAKIYVSSPTKISKLHALVLSSNNASQAINEYDSSKQGEKFMEDELDFLEGADIKESPAVKLVESILQAGIAQSASDIHIEPYESSVRVRYRIDGILRESTAFRKNMYPPVMTRIKIMSGMNIAEKRVPQDGRIKQVYDNKNYDFRVSTLPTINGEKIVIRILDTTSFGFSREQLSFLPEENHLIDELLKKPHGIILLTGPTGCGKSTTLYSFVREVNKEGVNVITVEDPIEYTMDGVNQVQVNVKADMTFARALRSILRQDPNIIMIGEIRDEETAQIAVRAAITGHLVFSTLHTNDAPGAVTRLVDFGIEPFFVTDALTGVIAQRLVRRLCPECKQGKMSTAEENHILGIKESKKIYHPKGCPACHGTGYKGRLGVHEIFVLDDELKEMVAKRVTTEEIREIAIKKGMLTLRDTCIKAILNGQTSIAELSTIVFSDNEE